MASPNNSSQPSQDGFLVAPARTLLGALPVGIFITGRKARLTTRIFDVLGAARSGMITRTVEGHSLSLDLSHPPERLIHCIGRNLFLSFRNTELHELMKRFLKPGSVFVDIGANLGIYSLLARNHGAESWCFEPEPRHAAFIRRNEKAYGRLFDLALSNEAGTARFFAPSDSNSGAGSLVASAGGNRDASAAGYDVRTERFDTLAKEAKLPLDRIALIKIDVEGAEASVVQGMKEYAASETAAPIWCEVRVPSSNRAPSSYKTVSELFAAGGYTAYEFSNGTTRPFTPRESLPMVFDILFLKPRHRAAMGL